jgi:hypothetical protein
VGGLDRPEDVESLPPSLQAKTDVAALTPTTTYFFRFRGVTKDGAGDWSASVSILML